MKFSLPISKFYFALILFVLPLHAQKITTAEIDILQKNISKLEWSSGEYRKAISLQYSTIEKSKKIQYTEGEIRGYLALANAFGGIHRPKDSFRFLNIAEQKLKNYDNPALKSRLYYLYGTYYFRLELQQEAIHNFNRSLSFTREIKDKELADKLRYDIYDWKRASFESLNMMDSVYSNERKCMASPKPMLFITISGRHLNKNQIDSAEYYIQKANELVMAKKAPIEGKSNVLRAYGKLYIKKGKYETALKYLSQSLEITHKMHFKKRDLETYKLMCEAYKGLNNIQKENEYLAKYTVLNDSLALAEKKQAYLPLEKLLSDQNEENKNDRNRLYYIIAAIITICTAVIFMLLRIFRKKEKENTSLIHQQAQETDILKKKLEIPVEELVQLAIRDDPSFLIKFKELYSDFYINLQSEFPQLTLNDMKFLALVKLKFSNKEIAEYAHMSIRTVESKKYRLRKKINLNSEIDFNKWILNRR